MSATLIESIFIGDERVFPAAGAAMAGWHEYPPDHPRRIQDADPATRDVKARLAQMDDYGVHAQLLYPNVALFNARRVVDLHDRDFPHPMSMAPGPASPALRPDDYLKSTFADLDEVSLRKILHDNAAKLYHLD